MSRPAGERLLRPDRPDLAIDTYDWLRHASEKSYDTWYFGSALEEDFEGPDGLRRTRRSLVARVAQEVAHLKGVPPAHDGQIVSHLP